MQFHKLKLTDEVINVKNYSLVLGSILRSAYLKNNKKYSDDELTKLWEVKLFAGTILTSQMKSVIHDPVSRPEVTRSLVDKVLSKKYKREVNSS